jgi:hypothetical protein
MQWNYWTWGKTMLKRSLWKKIMKIHANEALRAREVLPAPDAALLPGEGAEMHSENQGRATHLRTRLSRNWRRRIRVAWPATETPRGSVIV